MTAGAWVRASPVAAAVAAARTRLSAGSVELACHAAVPVAVDAGLLHLLRINFFLDPPTVLPFEAEAALLLSPLFREVGEDLYEIDPALRDALLASLVARFGPDRPARVAVLLEQYTDQHPTWHGQPELEHAQRLTALNLVDPARAADWLAANRASAGGPALTREWFVAMSGRLRPRTSLEERLNATLAAVGATDGPTRLTAVAELGELALLPGADVRRIALELEDAGRTGDPATQRLAQVVLNTVKQVIPPPEPSPIVEEGDDSYRAVPFPELHGIDPLTFDPVEVWAAPGGLKVPIGSDPDGRPVLLDLRDPSQGGMGPHGLVVGAGGAGRMELLRTIILGLAVTHSPSELNILAVNYLARGTFAGLETLPHLAGMATELSRDESLLDRLTEVIAGEISRRQEQSTRRHPHLLIIIDRVLDVLAAQPSVIDTLVMVGRVGRATGISLLLASQGLDEGRLRGLDPYLSFRIALRTSSAEESHAVLGGPEALKLPRSAGHGYLKSRWDDSMHRFRGSPVYVPYRPLPPSWDAVLDPFGHAGETLLDVLLARIAGHGDPVHQIWLPPLPAELALGDLPAVGVTVGEVDVPREHQVRTYSIDLTGASRHVAIVGGPGAGKTTALLTVVAALTRSSQPVRIYCIGGGLGSLIDLPGVIEVFEPDDNDAVVHLIESLLPAPAGDTVLVVDDWSDTVRRYPALNDLLYDGLATIVRANDGWDRFDDAVFGTFIELRLADPETSRISPAAARRLRLGTPGRALVADGLHLQIALPIGHLGGSHATYMRELSRPDHQYRRVRLGTFEPSGAEFAVDFTAGSHLLVLGGFHADRLAIRRAIERSVSGDIVGAGDAARVVEQLQRASGIRTTGADLWVIADGELEPLRALRNLLAHGRDLRLHVVAFASSYGSDPVVSELASLAVPLIVLSGDPAVRGSGELLTPGQPAQRIRLDLPRPSAGETAVSFAELHGIDPLTFDPAQTWAAPGNLTVPIGVTPDGSPVVLDLRDSSEGGTGPHGLIIGATGSGRTDLLRTMILGLAVTNSPDDLNILAVDLHDGDGFAGLESLPHLAGLALGAGDDPQLIERFEDVVLTEIARRQQASTRRLPRLLIVIDEFSEFHAARRSVINTLVNVCRVGPAIGMHLLLSTRRLREGQLQSLQTYLTFRVALRTSTPAESQAVLDSRDAFRLPREPGAGYLRTTAGTLRRFQATPFPDAVAARMAGRGGPVHQVWLPPLPRVVALGDLPADGITIGLADLPRDHRPAPFAIDLSGSSGHVAIVGERGSGTTTAAQAVVLALARRGEPCHVYCLGGGLNTVAGLPFVGGVFHRDDEAAMQRLVAFLKRRPRDAEPPVVVVVDNWARVVRNCPDVWDLLLLGDQVRVVATCPRWNGFGPDLGTMGTLVELSLEDPATSRFSVDTAAGIRGYRPGHGQIEGGGRVQLAAPVRQVGGNHHAYVAELAAAWTGPRAPRVEPDLRLRVGMHEDDGSDCVLDFAEHPHLLVHGSGGAVEALLAAVAGWAGRVFRDADDADLLDLLRSRLPGPNIPAQDLLLRIWWTGPELWLLITDRPGALDHLVEFLPQGRQLGFHLVVVDDGTSGGPSAAVERLIEMETPSITVSGSASPSDRDATIERRGQHRPVRLDLYRS